MMEGSGITNLNAYNAYYGNKFTDGVTPIKDNSNSIGVIAITGLIIIAAISVYSLYNYKSISKKLKA